MKKRLSTLIVCIAMLLTSLVFVLTGCGDKSNVKGIQVTTMPFVTEYTVGDTFDSDGLTVKKEYKDGTLETITDYTLSTPDMSTAGEKTITVTYGKYETTFTITVKEVATIESIELTSAPTKTRYVLGEELSLSGMKITATMSDGSDKTLSSSDYTVSQVDMTTTGEKMVTVTCGDMQESFTIEVYHGIAFNSLSEKEEPFMYENYLTDAWPAEGHRSADYNKGNDAYKIGAYWTYSFNAGSKIKSAIITLSYRFRTCMEVSFDGKNYQPLLQSVAIDQTVFSPEYRLENALNGEDGNLNFDDNKGVIYVRFRSAVQDMSGFGADVYNFGFYYTLVDESKEFEISGDPYAAMYKVEFAANTETEIKFLYKEVDTDIFDYTEEHTDLNGLHNRYVKNKNGQFIYSFDLNGTVSDAILQLWVAYHTLVEVSYDGVAWEEVFNRGSALGHQMVNIKLGETDGFDDNTGKIYVRFKNSVAEDDFGAALINFSMSYELVNESDYADPKPIEYVNPYIESATLSFDTCDTTESKYILDDMLNVWGENEYKFANSSTAYILYGFNFGAKLSATTLKIDIQFTYSKIEVSFDGANYTVIHEDNPASDSGVRTIEYDLSNVNGFSDNIGVLFLRCGSQETNSNGFDIAIHSVEIIYSLDGEFVTYPEIVKSAGLKQEETLYFKTDGGETDLKYYLTGYNDAIWNGNEYRFANSGDAYFIYGFDFGAKLTAATITLQLNQIYHRVYISFDGATWLEIINEESSKGWYNFNYDLSNQTAFASNTGILYVMCMGIPGNDGFNISLYEITVEYSLKGAFVVYPEVNTAGEVTLANGGFGFEVSGKGLETEYIIEQEDMGVWSGPVYKFANSANAYVLYGFDFGAKLASANLTLHIGQLYNQIKVSFDGLTYVTINEDILSPGQGGERDFTYDLSTVDGFANNDGRVFLWCGTYPGQGSFGLCLYTVEIDYELDGINALPYPAVTKAVADTAETQTSGKLSFDAKGAEDETKYILDSNATYVFGGDQFRTFNNGDGYVTYGFDFGAKLTSATLKLHAGQLYHKYQVSFDGSTWVTVYEVNPRPEGGGEFDFSKDLSEVDGFANNTGVLYVRIGGYPGNNIGFDCCLYNVAVDYVLEGEFTTYPEITKVTIVNE